MPEGGISNRDQSSVATVDPTPQAPCRTCPEHGNSGMVRQRTTRRRFLQGVLGGALLTFFGQFLPPVARLHRASSFHDCFPYYCYGYSCTCCHCEELQGFYLWCLCCSGSTSTGGNCLGQFKEICHTAPGCTDWGFWTGAYCYCWQHDPGQCVKAACIGQTCDIWQWWGGTC